MNPQLIPTLDKETLKQITIPQYPDCEFATVESSRSIFFNVEGNEVPIITCKVSQNDFCITKQKEGHRKCTCPKL